jgi:uncharacterized membrane protein YfcA
LLLGIGLSIGLLSGMFGVGGGFLITPILMMLGIPPTVAAASGANQMVAASASGTYTHWKLGNVDFKMGAMLLVGSFVGGVLGIYTVAMLKALGNADFIIKLTYVLVPITVGSYMVTESLQSIRSMKKTKADMRDAGTTGVGIPNYCMPSGKVDIHDNPDNIEEDKTPKTTSKVSREQSSFKRALKRLPFQTDFPKSGVIHSALLPIVLGVMVGILSAIMGVGGGFIMVPVMLYLLDMPILIVVGTSLFQVLFTVIEVTFLSAYTNHTVDFVLALVMLLGSSVGAQFGAMIGKKIDAEKLKILLAVLILAVGIKILAELAMNPLIHLAL